ncbi:hypothetical protein MMC07_004316 [Pseudocyphellaria aurata]|nr:hypothetical protein [Pseudocyphellaria aurata]
MSSDKMTSETRTRASSPSSDEDMETLQARYEQHGFRGSVAALQQKVERFVSERRLILRSNMGHSNIMRLPRLIFTTEGHLVIIGEEGRKPDWMDEEELKNLRNVHLVVTEEGRLVLAIEEDQIEDYMKERNSNNLRFGHFALAVGGYLHVRIIDEDQMKDWKDEDESNNPRFKQPGFTAKGLLVIMEKD